MNLQKKVVIITGAAGGLGKALSQAFAHDGCHLFLTDKNIGGLSQLVNKLAQTGTKVFADAADLANPMETKEVIDKAFDTYGRIDTLVNNAGVSAVKSFWELREGDWDEVLDVNVKGLFFALQAAAGHMLEGGGSIINIASVAGRLPRPTLMHYSASKAAVISITRSAALALAPSKIRVNAIAPGMMDTEMLHTLVPNLKDTSNGSSVGQPALNAVPLGRIAHPKEIASAAMFLASDAAGYITGQTLNVCGGISMN